VYPLFYNAIEKYRVAEKVSTPHTPGLLPKTVKPLHAKFTYPNGCPRNSTGVKIQKTAYTDTDLCAQLILVRSNPLFLSRSSKCYEKYIRARRFYCFHHARLFFCRKIATATAGHLELRVTLGYPGSRALRNSRAAPEQIKT
jgi:hypothetical protein